MRFCSVQIPSPPVSFPARLKTRIAPTPSGYLHLGNVLSFALTAFLAEQCGARILLRIDDLDHDGQIMRQAQDLRCSGQSALIPKSWIVHNWSFPR